MTTQQIKRVRWACATTNLSMSVVGNLSPVLFLTFRSLYGISYSLLGFLVLINFVTQLAVDLIFSFFSHKFDIPKTVKSIPYFTMAGLCVYALWPCLFPNSVYTGLLIGTVIFSASSGLSEVLISPVVAALPSDDPDREMSKLHSVYAWGVVFVIIFSTIFLLVFGQKSWQILSLCFVFIPLVSAVLYYGAVIPHMETPEKTSGALKMLRNGGVWLCFLAMFLGGASECTMAQWSSSYLEQALSIPKIWGDVFGVALFSVMLGLGRSLYGKFGTNIGPVLIAGSIGASVCYLTAAVVPFPIVGLMACALTGFCTSMLWPGNLIVASDRYPMGGVFIYALMAAGGDLGASVVPQLVGIVTDAAIEVPAVTAFAEYVGILPEQFGMKLGMLVAMVFPLIGIPVYTYMSSTARSKDKGKI